MTTPPPATPPPGFAQGLRFAHLYPRHLDLGLDCETCRLLATLDAERIAATARVDGLRSALDETTRLLEYLWSATGNRARDMPVYDLFNDDDPLVQDVPTVLGKARIALHSGAALAETRPPAEPGAWLSRELLLRVVDLRAVAWNALCAVPAAGGSWERFWRKLHRLRESVNRPEHEDIRIAYAKTFPNAGGAAERDDTKVLDDHWRIVDRDARLAEPRIPEASDDPA